MKISYLYLLGIAMACLALAWAYNECQSAFQNAQAAKSQQLRCESIVGHIEFLRARNRHSSVITSANFDPAKSVMQAARAAGIPLVNYSVNQSRLRKIEKTDVRQWQVGVPASSLPLKNVVRFARNLATGDVTYQVNRIDLRPDRQQSDQVEHWKTDFSISLMKRDGEK